jgi:excisionase family DNA binding protein
VLIKSIEYDRFNIDENRAGRKSRTSGAALTSGLAPRERDPEGLFILRREVMNKGRDAGNGAAAVITNQIIAPTYYFKEILTKEEAAAYIGIKPDGISQYVHFNKIPYYKPVGERGFSYFKKSELDKFMLRNRHPADYEVHEAADAKLNGEA